MPSMSCCPLRHHGTGVLLGFKKGWVWVVLLPVFGLVLGSCFHFGNSYEGLSVWIGWFLGDKGV